MNTKKEFPKLNDRDVELTYDQLKAFFQKLAKGKELDEPESTNPARHALIDAILEVLDMREEMAADEAYILNENYRFGGNLIPNIEVFYSSGFNYLRRSVRFWRKERGQNGYLKFLSEQMP
ncbi:hypothetical protein [Flavilitoribacter nigricans]|nr:hypothetical protein [Flavilitoribacter nigricans]